MLRCNKIIEFFFFLVEIKDRKLYRDSKVLQAGLGKKKLENSTKLETILLVSNVS